VGESMTHSEKEDKIFSLITEVNDLKEWESDPLWRPDNLFLRYKRIAREFAAILSSQFIEDGIESSN
jgi:hypothetical protein